MAKQLLTNIIAAGGLLAAVAAVSVGDARAFTETPVPPPTQNNGAQAQPGTPQLQLQKPADGNGLALTAPGDANAGGTEVKIPGVGSVGVLPKLDFGLELLYGGNTPAAEKPLDNKDDMQIKGTITHRF